MINRFAYVSMTGAKASTEQLAVTSNNLANGLTPGFKEVISAFRAVPLRAALFWQFFNCLFKGKKYE
jgi:flagellar basal-body rod protein FlgF